MWRKTILTVAAGLLVMAVQAADVSKLSPASTKKNITFAKDIKPLFERSCFKCHGEEKQKGELRVDSPEAIKKGSEYGEVIVVGDGAKSGLLHVMAGLVEDSMMPPEGKADPLTKEELGLVRAWIDQGAK